MNNQEFPTPEFKDAITNLVLEDGLGRQPIVSLETRPVVQAGLERAVVDPSSLRAFLGYLEDTHRVRHPFKRSDLLPPKKLDEILAEGLACLSPAELAELALNPLQLMDVGDQLAEREPSEHWLSIIWRYNREAALLAEVFDEHREELDAIFAPGESARESRQLVGAFGDRDTNATDTGRPSTAQRPWHEEVPLAGANVEWLQVIDQVKADADRQRTVRVDFAWQPITSGSPRMLCVRLGAPLLVAGSSNADVSLLDADGQTIVSGERHATEFRLSLAPADEPRARQLQVIYNREGKYRIRLTVPFSPPT